MDPDGSCWILLDPLDPIGTWWILLEPGGSYWILVDPVDPIGSTGSTRIRFFPLAFSKLDGDNRKGNLRDYNSITTISK